MSVERAGDELDRDNGPGDGEDEHRRLLQNSVPATRSDRYANADYLSRYVPDFEHEKLRPRNMKGRMAETIKMLRLQLAVAALVFTVQLSATVWSVLTFAPDERGTGTFTLGDCSNIRSADSVIHVVLNIMSSLFLGAGHYCMQILVAPSREELDSAHHKGRAMEIGVPSLKNLKYIPSSRVAGWVMLGVIATLLHVFWNSSVFTSLPIAVVPVAIATADFQTAADNWTASDSLAGQFRSWWPHMSGYEEEQNSMIYALQAAATNFTRIDIDACVKQYVDPRDPTSPLIVVARNVTTAQNNGSSLIDGGVVGWLSWEWSNSWICQAYQPTVWRYCNWDFAKTFVDQWTLVQQRAVRVDHCLVGEGANNAKRCGLHYSTQVAIIVCICTLLDLLLICWTAWHHTRHATKGRGKQRLLTIGDAIQSFLDTPGTPADQAVDAGAPRRPKQRSVELALATWRTQSRVPWLKAISPFFWTTSLVLFAAGVSVGSYAFWLSIRYLKTSGLDTSIAAIWRNGFGITPPMIASELPGALSGIDRSGTAALLANILIANSPQVMVSFLYFFYNSILTRQLAADEWVRFLRKDGKKALRVSSPLGMQRSSHFLSLPFKYSVPLTAVSILLNWVISQSIFLVQSSAFSSGPNGQRLRMCDYSARGYSLGGTILAISVGFSAIAALLLNSLVRQYEDIPPGFQRTAFHSMAIQAICQRPEGDSDAAFFPVRIGVSTDTGPSGTRCWPQIVFSTDTELQTPKDGEQYLQPVFVKGVGPGRSLVAIARKASHRICLAIENVWNRLVWGTSSKAPAPSSRPRRSDEDGISLYEGLREL